MVSRVMLMAPTLPYPVQRKEHFALPFFVLRVRSSLLSRLYAATNYDLLSVNDIFDDELNRSLCHPSAPTGHEAHPDLKINRLLLRSSSPTHQTKFVHNGPPHLPFATMNQR